MKKRLIALFLCSALLFGMFPVALTMADPDTHALAIYAEGAYVEEVELEHSEKLTLTAMLQESGAYDLQWQIRISGDNWANIVGSTGTTLELSYPMVANLLSGGVAAVRCRAINGVDNVTYSNVVTVGVTTSASVAGTPAADTADSPVVLSSGMFQVATAEASAPAADEAGETEASGEENVSGIAVFSDEGVAVVDSASDVKKTYNIVVNYTFENNEIVADPYTANLAEGSSFSATVTFPEVLGYLPYVNDLQQNSMELSYPSISENVTINVVYKPTNVNYTVIHYLQNVDNDQYTIESTETKQGLTKSQVPEVAKTFEGFYSLLYERPAIAADGSTVIEVYYDRYYYLMNFDMDGGYGTEPIYARYGASIGTVTNPTNAGYNFAGWMLNGTDAEIPSTMPSENRTYVAKWVVGNPVNYAVVYWKENADDSGYSYWGQQQKTAEAGSRVSGSDDIPKSVHNDEKKYFTYNAARTDSNVLVKGDGSTVVNVYYYRNTYTIYFKGISGICAIEEHTHGTNCNKRLICQKGEHTHDDTCIRTLSCKLNVHEHVDDCTGLLCTTPVHTAHTADCLICGKTEHTHSGYTGECYELSCTTNEHEHSNCTINCAHVHDTSCYKTGENSYYALKEVSRPNQNLIHIGDGIYTYTTTDTNYWGGTSTTTHYYLNIGVRWYCARDAYVGNGGGDTTKITLNCQHTHDDSCYTCGQTAHTHNGSCYTLICKQEVHSHTDKCYKDVLHTHTDACYGLICGQAAHTHTDACYTYSCSNVAHTHTDSCYSTCTKLEHTHNYRCNQNSSDNVIYVVTAKYEQNIADVWPTADKFPNITLKGWTIDGVDYTAVSKRVNMTSDLCDTSDNLKYAKANTGGQKRYLYYMFESFDQSSAANGDERKYLNSLYYDKSETYYQEVNSDGSWNQKQIAGMTAVSNGVVTSGSKVFLYYTRNRNDISFYNVNATVKTVSDVMYEQPLKDYKDSSGNLLSSFKPDYPSSLEPGAYEFAGWYTTPECYAGTEFNFTTATMPDDDLTLYAKWVPVTHTVKFYLTEKSESIYKPVAAEKEASFTVSHAGTLDEVYVNSNLTIKAMNDAKPNGDYTFVMWYYYENGDKKPFDPTTQIRKDLTLYGEWSSNTLKQYTVQYVLKDDHSVKIADDLTGSGLAGTTKTFDAKGGTELYAAYQEGYFPTVQSQSLLLDIESNSLVITFEYVPMPAVPYTVKYVEKDTGKSLADDKVVSDNRKAVVTETFQPISGYMPDAYQKRLVVTADGENILYFYYTKDATHAYYKITHYTQNTDGATWTDYASSQVVGDIGTRYTASPMTIPGFTYQETKYAVNGTDVTDVTADGAKLTADGLEINLYYVRNDYPYQVRYLEQGSGKVLHAPKSATGKYGQVISESAIDIDGYDKVNPTSATISIKIETDNAAKLNVITFYYKEQEVTINYVAVGPTGATNFGSVNPTTETVKAMSGAAQGSTPTAGDGFRFVGWFKDEACTEAVDASWVESNKLTPQKTNDKNVAATYYAKFEYDVTSLTIQKKVNGNQYDTNEMFIFNISGPDGYTNRVVVKAGESVTINGLKVGSAYTVTEDTSWSWRYTTSSDKSNPITLTATASSNVVVFTNTLSKHNWLTGDAYADNNFNK